MHLGRQWKGWRAAAVALLASAALLPLGAQGRVRVEGRRGRKGEAVDAGQVVITRLPSGDPSPVPQPELPTPW